MDVSYAIRQGRHISGIILFIYVFSHLINHSLGIISITAMEQGRDVFLFFWRSIPGTLLLYGSLSLHFILAVLAILAKRKFFFTRIEIVQISFGFLIPFFLIIHIFETRYAYEFLNMEDKYIMLIANYWTYAEDKFGIPGLFHPIILILFAWTHGIIGILKAFKHKSWFGNIKNYFSFFSFGLPFFAIAGYLVSGAAVITEKKFNSQKLEARAFCDNGYCTQGFYEYVRLAGEVENWYIVVVFGMFCAFIMSVTFRKSFASIKIEYPNKRIVISGLGATILETSQDNGIPHASICGGNARCSTCRIKVTSDLDDLPRYSEIEYNLVKKLRFSKDIRLACQLRPTKNISVIPLTPVKSTILGTKNSSRIIKEFSGVEKELVVVFIDLRGFTTIAEKRLPYDTIYILNKYFEVAGDSIQANKGRIDKFIGDGIMAIFDHSNNIKKNSFDAIKAATELSSKLKHLNIILKDELEKPLNIGIGIHKGKSVSGLVGYGENYAETAIGDVVNVASRLESSCKDLKCQLVASEEVIVAAGLNPSSFAKAKISIKGRSGKINVYMIKDATKINMTKI